MSKGGGTTETTNEPWAELQPYLIGDGPNEAGYYVGDRLVSTDPNYQPSGGRLSRAAKWRDASEGTTGLFPQAQAIYDQGPHTFFPGQTYAGFDPLQTQSQNLAIDYANSGLNGLLPATMDSYKNVVSGGLMSPDSNPYLRDNISTMADIVKENAMTGAWSANDDRAVSTGNIGSSKYFQNQQGIMKDVNEVIARNTNDMLTKNYNTGLNAMMSGFGMAPQMGNFGMSGSNLLNTIGKERQAMEQMGINEAKARHDFEYEAPWLHLNNYMSPLTGNYMGAGGTTTQPVTGSNPIAGALGGLTAGAGLMQAMGSTNPWIAGSGAVLGLLGSR